VREPVSATKRACGCFGWASYIPPLVSVANQIADNLDQIGFMVRDFQAGDFLDQYYQFEAIKPVGAQIANKMSIIGHTPYVDVQSLGDKSTYLLDIDAAPICSPCSLTLADGNNCHDELPFHEPWHGLPRASPDILFDVYGRVLAILSPQVCRYKRNTPYALQDHSPARVSKICRLGA